MSAYQLQVRDSAYLRAESSRQSGQQQKKPDGRIV